MQRQSLFNSFQFKLKHILVLSNCIPVMSGTFQVVSLCLVLILIDNSEYLFQFKKFLKGSGVM